MKKNICLLLRNWGALFAKGLVTKERQHKYTISAQDRAGEEAHTMTLFLYANHTTQENLESTDLGLKVSLSTTDLPKKNY